MTPTLESLIAVLIVVVIVVLVVLTIFLVKFVQELTSTITNINGLIDTTKQEIIPALKSVNNILATVNNVSNATNHQLETIKKILTTMLGASCLALGTVKSKGGFINGLVSGFNFFRKKGDKNVNR